MKTYEKPIISVDEGLAEGVYAAASGSKSLISIGTPTVIADWGSNGQAKFEADYSRIPASDRTHLSVTITFNMPIASAWGGGASVSVNASTATFSHYNAPEKPELFVQVNGNVNNLKVEGYAYTTA